MAEVVISQDIEQPAATARGFSREASELQSMRAMLDDLFNRCKETALKPFADVAMNCTALIDDIENNCVADEDYAIQLLRESVEQLINGLESTPLPARAIATATGETDSTDELPTIETISLPRPAPSTSRGSTPVAELQHALADEDCPADRVNALNRALRQLMIERQALRCDQPLEGSVLRRLARAVDDVLSHVDTTPLDSRRIAGMLVRIADRACVIPAPAIQTTITVKEHAALAAIGHVIPVLIHGWRNNAAQPSDHDLLIVVSTPSGSGAIFVDEIIEQRTFDLLPFGRGVGRAHGSLGGVILPGGGVALVLNALQMNAREPQGGFA